jgi:hypothetical protein
MRTMPDHMLEFRAWHNVISAAVNEGLERGLFTAEPYDNRGLNDDGATELAFKFGETIPARAMIRATSSGGDVLLHVALWPTRGADRWLGHNLGQFLAGQIEATGWLLRRSHGAWIDRTPSLFRHRPNRLAAVAAVNGTPLIPVAPTRRALAH